MTTTATDADTAAYDRYAADLVSGRVFDRYAASERSRYGYQAPLAHREWARAVSVLGEYAQRGDRAAATSAAVLRVLNLYATRGDLLARVADALADVARGGYDDVIGRTGPEAGPASAHHHPTKLADAIALGLLFAEIEAAVEFGGSRAHIGWVLAHLAKREHVNTAHLPLVTKALYPPQQ